MVQTSNAPKQGPAETATWQVPVGADTRPQSGPLEVTGVKDLAQQAEVQSYTFGGQPLTGSIKLRPAESAGLDQVSISAGNFTYSPYSPDTARRELMLGAIGQPGATRTLHPEAPFASLQEPMFYQPTGSLFDKTLQRFGIEKIDGAFTLARGQERGFITMSSAEQKHEFLCDGKYVTYTFQGASELLQGLTQILGSPLEITEFSIETNGKQVHYAPGVTFQTGERFSTSIEAGVDRVLTQIGGLTPKPGHLFSGPIGGDGPTGSAAPFSLNQYELPKSQGLITTLAFPRFDLILGTDATRNVIAVRNRNESSASGLTFRGLYAQEFTAQGRTDGLFGSIGFEHDIKNAVINLKIGMFGVIPAEGGMSTASGHNKPETAAWINVELRPKKFTDSFRGR